MIKRVKASEMEALDYSGRTNGDDGGKIWAALFAVHCAFSNLRIKKPTATELNLN